MRKVLGIVDASFAERQQRVRELSAAAALVSSAKTAAPLSTPASAVAPVEKPLVGSSEAAVPSREPDLVGEVEEAQAEESEETALCDLGGIGGGDDGDESADPLGIAVQPLVSPLFVVSRDLGVSLLRTAKAAPSQCSALRDREL